MAFDEALADRIRDLLAPRSEVSERKMFGGIAFMVGGNMCCGALADGSTLAPTTPRRCRQSRRSRRCGVE